MTALHNTGALPLAFLYTFNMIEKLSLLEQQIIDCLKTDYGLDVATLTFLPLGADMDALVYKAQAHHGSSYFVKLKRGHPHDLSALVIALLREAGIQHLIPIVKTLRGDSARRLNDFTMTVSPFIEGKDGFSRDLTDDQWSALGKVMMHLHEMEIPSSLQSMVRRETYSPERRGIVRSFYLLMDSNPRGDEIALKLLTFMKMHEATIRRLVDRAEELSRKLQEQSPPFVLCHSDLHGGNILIEENDSFYIVDWDDPVLAPKERDLMFIGGGVGNVWNNPHEEALFYEGYGKVNVNGMALTYYRHERIVEDIAEYGRQLLLTTEGGPNRIQWYKEFISQFEPQGVVEIAFKTDEGLAP